MRLLFSAAFVFVGISCLAQAPFRKNTFYAELAGNGLFLSVNYEKQVLNKPGLGLHIGAGLGGVRPMIPLGATYLWPLKNTRSFIECGAGITLGEKQMLDDIFTRGSTRYIPAYVPSIGLRHHTNYGLMWKIIYSPVFTEYRSIPYYGGFSLGWRI